MATHVIEARCRRCGARVSANALGGLCPRCVASIGVPSGGEGSGTAEDAIRYFGDYELIHEIARGGMGVVYAARQVSLNRIVAVKMILSGALASEKDVQRFRAEAEAAANLRHPNIVTIHEIGQHKGQHYFSMEYIDGQNLAEVGRGQPMSARGAAECVKTLAEAVDYAHLQGTLHRDLKPSNVLLDEHGQPHITDFGLAKRLREDASLTATGQVLGTPSFIPPELAAGRHESVGPHTDLYALGAILYFLLTGRAPFAGQNLEETLTQVLNKEPVPPRTINPAVPRDLETICLKCLEKDWQRRYPKASELARDLDRFLLGEPVHARPAGQMEKLWRWACRHSVVATLATGLMVALVALIALFIALVWRARPARIAPIPILSGCGVSAEIQGKLYLTSPCDGHGGSRTHFHRYDPADNTWEMLPVTPVVHGNGAAGVINGLLYVAGGTDEKAQLTTRLDVFDPVANYWTNRASLPTRLHHTAGAVLDGKFFVVGGLQEREGLTSVVVHDPATDQWTAGPELPEPRAGHSVVALNDTLYVVGGTDGQNHFYGTVLTLKGGRWAPSSPMPHAVSSAFVAATTNAIFVAGGKATNGQSIATFQRYDIATDRWELLPPMPEPRADGSDGHWVNGELYILGGWANKPPLPQQDVFAYNPKTRTWRR